MVIKSVKLLVIDQMAINYTNIFLFKTLQNLPKRMLLGLKLNHLATPM
jgi:hypothetical protein